MRLRVVLCCCLSAGLALGDDYPSRPLTVVVGLGVGGSADRMTRTMSGFLAAELGTADSLSG